ncbi:hypothetical protein IGB42_03620 [Andreprevotia sp. IGB-42]|uniref:hypothetical protein n=1 Tax=Andreprevotia sp. IGB-42 TaxID=2497473 RepID=UPI00135C7509|nr:hypothetical protein [Andreprevotia sp. IGB-42]KAF0811810.1 hypothetical protein IGB42_03620 [Andreprevotia sp. IGB-42]
MNRFLLVPLALLPALLVACGSDDPVVVTPTPAPVLKVDALAEGTYMVALGNEAQPASGQYYAAADGTRLLVVNDDSERVQTLYKQTAGGAWTSVPAAKTAATISLLRSDTATAAVTDAAKLVGRYIAQTPAGANAAFTLAADGTLAPLAGSVCQLAGKAVAGKLPGTLAVTLTLAGCSGLPASASGILVADTAYAPARFRLLADDGSQSVDLWAYSE